MLADLRHYFHPTVNSITSAAIPNEKSNGPREASDGLLERVSRLEKTMLGSSPPGPHGLQDRIKSLEIELAVIKGEHQNRRRSVPLHSIDVVSNQLSKQGLSRR